MRYPIISVLVTSLSLTACGGGGGGGSSAPAPAPVANTGNTNTNTNTNSGSSNTNTFQRGVFAPSETFEQSCTTTLAQNNWLRSWSNELYLWYDEITDRNPANFSDTEAYFDLLKTNELTASGNPKDRFHFTLPTDEWEALSQSGISAGYGATWSVISPSVPRRVVVAYTEPGSEAADNDLERGTEIVGVNGIDIVNDDSTGAADSINAALFPSDSGQSNTFEVLDLGAEATRTFSMTSAEVTSDPVQAVGFVDSANGRIGYMVFNDHIATSEQQLIDAIETLRDDGVDELVLDIRYNGGGFLDIANELAFMITGPNATAGKTFEVMRFNDKHPNVNPVTNQQLAPETFHSTAQGFSAVSGSDLPFLGLNRVYVLTGPDTCSASESVINSLRGIDTEVILIGETTCGKPFGFYPFDNCGTTYFTIQFQVANDKGFGNFPDGFSPANLGTTEGVPVPGCAVADDYSHDLGDPEEARFAAAINHIETGECPSEGASARASVTSETQLDSVTGQVIKSRWHTNRIYRP